MMTEVEFALKIEWEGGEVDALEYGMTPEECEPGALRDAYAVLHAAYWADGGFRDKLRAVENLTRERLDECA